MVKLSEEAPPVDLCFISHIFLNICKHECFLHSQLTKYSVLHLAFSSKTSMQNTKLTSQSAL